MKLSPVPTAGAVIEPKVSVFVPPVGVIWTVPAPAEIVLAAPEEVEDLGIPQIGYYYRQVYHTYTVEPY